MQRHVSIPFSAAMEDTITPEQAMQVLNTSHTTPQPASMVQAAREGSVSTIRYLNALSVGVNAMAAQGKGQAIHEAARCRRGDQALSWLVRFGADINSTENSESGWTPLHVAASEGNARCVAALLDLRADPNLPDVEGNTPLHLACRRRLATHTEAAEILARFKGVKRDMRNHDFEEPDVSALSICFHAQEYVRSAPFALLFVFNLLLVLAMRLRPPVVIYLALFLQIGAFLMFSGYFT